MSPADNPGSTTKPRTRAKAKPETKVERPPLWKVILLNDDYTPREFVVQVLKAVFGSTKAKPTA